MKNKNSFKGKIWMIVGLMSLGSFQEGHAEGYLSSIRNWFSPNKKQEENDQEKKEQEGVKAAQKAIENNRLGRDFREAQTPFFVGSQRDTDANKKTFDTNNQTFQEFEKYNRFFADENSSKQKGWVKEANNASSNVFSDLLNAEKSIQMIDDFIINEAQNLKNNAATYSFMDIEDYIDGGAGVLQNLFLQSVPVNGRSSSKYKMEYLQSNLEKTKINIKKYKKSFNLCLDQKENNCNSKYLYLLKVFNKASQSLKKSLILAYDMVKRNLGRLKEDHADDINTLTLNRRNNIVTMSGYSKTLKYLLDLVSKRRPLSGDAEQIKKFKDTAQLFHNYAKAVQKILAAKGSPHKEPFLQGESSLEDLLKDL